MIVSNDNLEIHKCMHSPIIGTPLSAFGKCFLEIYCQITGEVLLSIIVGQ